MKKKDTIMYSLDLMCFIFKLLKLNINCVKALYASF